MTTSLPSDTLNLPQVAETNTPCLLDAAGKCLLYDEIEQITQTRRNIMLYTIIVILIILWLLGFLGSNISPSFPKTGGWIHTLLVLAVILIILNLLGII